MWGGLPHAESKSVHRVGITRRLILAVVATALALGLAGTALAEQRRIDPADQALATSAVLRQSDMPTNAPWKANPSADQPGASTSCPGYHPKTSDLVQTGGAESAFSTTGIAVFDGVALLETPAMVAHDWQRSVGPGFLSCVERSVIAAGHGQLAVVSTSHVAMPGIAPRARAYRVVLGSSSGRSNRLAVIDVLIFAGGRTEATLVVTAFIGDPSQQQAAAAATTALDTHFAQVIAGRAAMA
jgi:hypothetical protein